MGGLADRFKGAVFTYSLAKLLNRKFNIEWSEPFCIEDIFKQNVSDWKAVRSGEESTGSVDLVDNNFSAKEKELIASGLDGITSLIGNKERIKVFSNSMPIELLKTAAEEACWPKHMLQSKQSFFYCQFNQIFRYAPDVRFYDKESMFDRLRRQYDAVVGIQFRTGGEGQWRDPSVDSPNNCLKLCRLVERQMRSYSVGNYSLFLTTDSSTVKKLVHRYFEGRKEVLTFNDPPVHIDRSVGKAAEFGAAQVCLEHTLLSKCDHIFCGKGGFGVTAAWRENKTPIRYHKVRDSDSK